MGVGRSEVGDGTLDPKSLEWHVCVGDLLGLVSVGTIIGESTAGCSITADSKSTIESVPQSSSAINSSSPVSIVLVCPSMLVLTLASCVSGFDNASIRSRSLFSWFGSIYMFHNI